MPQVKISTQAAVLRPTPGSESRNSSDSSRGAVSVQSRSGCSPSCSRIAWIRGAFCLPRPPGRIASSTSLDRRVAHLLPGREALAQGGEGAVAVAVVGVLGEHRLDQLGDRVPVRLVDRLPVHLPQPVADRPHPPLVGSLPAPRPGPYAPAIWLARGGRSKRASCGSTGCASSTGGCRARGRRPSTATATPPTARTGCRSWSAAARRSRSTCRAGGARTARPGALRLLDVRALGLPRALPRRARGRPAQAGRPRLGLPGADRRPAAAGAGREAGRRSTPCRCCPATAGTGSPRSGAAAAVGELANATTTKSSMALLMRQARGRPQRRCRRSSSTWSGATGTRAPAPRRSPSTATPTPTASPTPARTSTASPVPPWSSGATATPTSRPVRRGLRRRPSPTPSSSSSPAPATGPGSTTPAVIDRVARLPRLIRAAFGPLTGGLQLAVRVSCLRRASAPSCPKAGATPGARSASSSASTSPTSWSAASPTASAPTRSPTASR